MLEANRSVRGIIEAAQLMKGNAGVAATGPIFVTGDFLVRIGKVGQRSSDELSKSAVLIDVEYTPVDAWKIACPVLLVCPCVAIHPGVDCGGVACGGGVFFILGVPGCAHAHLQWRARGTGYAGR